MDKVQNDPAPLPPSVRLSAARWLSHNAQLFLKKEKSLRSRSARRWARLDGWRGGADSEEWAERHSSWYLSISCWSITRCMSSCGPERQHQRAAGGAELNAWVAHRWSVDGGDCEQGEDATVGGATASIVIGCKMMDLH